MANCCITSSIRNPDCRPEGAGGIREIYLANLKDISSIAYDTCGNVQDIVMCPEKCFYTFEVLDETGQFIQNVEKNNGLYNADMQLNGRIVAIDCDTLATVKQLAGARVVAILVDNNGNFVVAGVVSGLTLQTANFDSGTARTDAFGTAITLSGFEGFITGGYKAFLAGNELDPESVRKEATKALIETIACDTLGNVCGCDEGN